MPTRRTFLAAIAQNILDIPAPKPGEHIAYGAGPFQFAELRLPPGRGPHPVAILIHGGYWRARYDLVHLGHLCEAVTAQGLATWSVEYRRIGNPGGGWPGTFDDIRAAALHLNRIATEKSLDLKRVVVAGHSAGGQLALWLAEQKSIPFRGVVALAAVADLRRAFEFKLSDNAAAELLGGSPQQFPDRYRAASPVEFVPLGLPQRILHGLSDDVVPIELSRTYAAAAKKAGDDARLIEIPNAGHFDLIDPRSSAWPTVKQAILEMVE